MTAADAVTVVSLRPAAARSTAGEICQAAVRLLGAAVIAGGVAGQTAPVEWAAASPRAGPKPQTPSHTDRSAMIATTVRTRPSTHRGCMRYRAPPTQRPIEGERRR